MGNISPGSKSFCHRQLISINRLHHCRYQSIDVSEILRLPASLVLVGNMTIYSPAQGAHPPSSTFLYLGARSIHSGSPQQPGEPRKRFAYGFNYAENKSPKALGGARDAVSNRV
ncbi:uncharacterized protein PV07_03082 [Cladophialophora immunda]|uniref:Uncharacterized protein n=1 Tax=Cladophialophora immunda TaxID=569365 RepID=A0A0D2B1E9_9EURO|nr:uncharacterized protein PV07_03082 [Cladophialophora immunda]KIW31432.1 hypothetical protein PV07_03082 [Cladophialophora immunda]